MSTPWDAPPACSRDEINSLVRNITTTIKQAQPAALHYLHLDGPFWEGCWPNCTRESWDVNGYTVDAIEEADGVLAESWVQGSLPVGLRKVLDEWRVVRRDRIMVLNDVPNCDLYPAEVPCATGTVAGDHEVWGRWMTEVGVWVCVCVCGCECVCGCVCAGRLR